MFEHLKSLDMALRMRAVAFKAYTPIAVDGWPCAWLSQAVITASLSFLCSCGMSPAVDGMTFPREVARRGRTGAAPFLDLKVHIPQNKYCLPVRDVL
jgi:hypothetical protein